MLKTLKIHFLSVINERFSIINPDLSLIKGNLKYFPHEKHLFTGSFYVYLDNINYNPSLEYKNGKVKF